MYKCQVCNTQLDESSYIQAESNIFSREFNAEYEGYKRGIEMAAKTIEDYADRYPEEPVAAFIKSILADCEKMIRMKVHAYIQQQ